MSMRALTRLIIAVGFVGLLGCYFSRTALQTIHAQTQSTSLQLTTPEHLQIEDWWPTKATFPLKAFAGSDSCVSCHTEESGSSTSMQRAATRSPSAKFLQTGKASFSPKPLTYELSGTPEGLEYSVSNETGKLNRRLDWVMGAGELGRTFLYESDHRWYQSQATYYTHISALDITTGLPFDSNAGLSAALGTALSPSDARACFGCHTVHPTTSAGFDPAHAEVGLGCEACHGPAQAHAANATAHGKPGSAHVAGVFNPAKLSPADSIDFCGSCHRTFADAALSLGGQQSTAAVRFQPYRLEESKCWRATQSEKLTCVSCHNPHGPLSHDSFAYDKRCLSCHSPHAAPGATTVGAEGSPKTCPKSTKDCTSCHMPKVEVASMHGDFTDHFIRIVRSRNEFPK